MSVKVSRSMPSAGVVEKLLDLDSGTVTSVVKAIVHNQGTSTDVVKIWLTLTGSVATGFHPPDSDLCYTISVEQGESVTFDCGYLASNENVWAESANGTSSIRVSALVEIDAS